MKRYLMLIIMINININASTETILIPDDAPSLQEAVELAASGDVIQIVTPEFYWTKVEKRDSRYQYGNPLGVNILGKNLSIVGMNSISRVNTDVYYNGLEEGLHTLLIEDSSVDIENIHLPEPMYVYDNQGFPYPIPISFKSSNVIIRNCTLSGFIESQGNLTIDHSSIIGHSWFYNRPYTGFNLFNPALKVGPANEISLTIIDSEITSNSSEGFINLTFDEVDNSTIVIDNSRLRGGTFDIVWGSLPQDIHGTDSIRISNCNNTVFDIQNSFFQGGDGYHAITHRGSFWDRERNFLGGGNGGNGLSILNSNITLLDNNSISSFTGGNGGNGQVDIYPGSELVRNAGNGGNGIAIIQSTIHAEQGFFDQMELTPGIGGKGHEYENKVALPGEPGQRFLIDAESNIIYTSNIQNWMLMQ